MQSLTLVFGEQYAGQTIIARRLVTPEKTGITVHLSTAGQAYRFRGLPVQGMTSRAKKIVCRHFTWFFKENAWTIARGDAYVIACCCLIAALKGHDRPNKTATPP